MRELVIPLTTGLTIFLFGMQVLTIGLERLAGERLKKWLKQFTQTPLTSFLTGLTVTLFLQSSSAVTVIAIGFVNAKLMRFPRCIGLLLGTNVGTCITTELLVLPTQKLAVWLVVAGAGCWLLPWRGIRFIGLSTGGLGCVFLGMQTMEGLADALNHFGALELLSAYSSTFWGIVSGTVLTAIIQSSSASIALLMGLYNTQAIPLSFGLAAVLGSNVGTCATAWIASISGSRTGKQVAMAHTLINVVGMIAFYPFITSLSQWLIVTDLSPNAQLAHFQTGFNLVCALLLLPFCGMIARAVQFLLPSAAKSA